MRLNLFVFFIFITNSLFAQINIRGKITLFPNNEFLVCTYYNSEQQVFDTIKTSSDGTFSYQMEEYTGIIKFKNQQASFDLLINNEKDISFELNQFYPSITISFEKSHENKVYYEYLMRKQEFLKKRGLLMPLIFDYPKEEAFYNEIKNEFITINELYEKFLDSIIESSKTELCNAIIKFERAPYIHPNTSDQKAIEILKRDFFKYANFEDTLIFQTPVYSKKVVEYLSFYSSKQFTKEQQEEAFMDAATKLMEFTYDYPAAYTYMIDYLIKGFKQFGFDAVVDYIAENSDIEGSCKNENVNEEVQRRIENLKKMTIGKSAPNIFSIDLQGSVIDLSKSKAKYNLVVFWSSACPHCQKMMPKIHKIYEELGSDQMQVFSVSLDTSKVDFNNFLEEHTFSWIDICDFEGWHSPMAKDYNIYATPMMFLLDDQLEIVAKPLNARELDKYIKSNGN